MARVHQCDSRLQSARSTGTSASLASRRLPQPASLWAPSPPAQGRKCRRPIRRPGRRETDRCVAPGAPDAGTRLARRSERDFQTAGKSMVQARGGDVRADGARWKLRFVERERARGTVRVSRAARGARRARHVGNPSRRARSKRRAAQLPPAPPYAGTAAARSPLRAARPVRRGDGAVRARWSACRGRSHVATRPVAGAARYHCAAPPEARAENGANRARRAAHVAAVPMRTVPDEFTLFYDAGRPLAVTLRAGNGRLGTRPQPVRARRSGGTPGAARPAIRSRSTASPRADPLRWQAC